VYNLAKTCEAINAQEDFNVKLITTDQNNYVDVFFRKMAVHQSFEVVCLGVTNTLSHHGGKKWYELFRFLYANIRLTSFLFTRSREFDAVYLRDDTLFPTIFLVKIILRKKVFFETHAVLQKKLRQSMNQAAVRLADGVIAISSGLKRYYSSSNKNILLSLCSAAEDSWFDHKKSKDVFRRELGLPEDSFLTGYTGVVGANPNNDYYEIDDIIMSLPLLPKKVKCVIVGELNDNAKWLRDIAENAGVLDRVIIIPWRERSEIPKYLQAFDVIFIPKRKKDLIGDSPAKMFPALAARRPIIGGRAESIEEVLTDGKDSIIVEKNSPEGWSKAVLKIYNNPELAESISNIAWDTHNRYTWEKRGIDIAKFINKTTRGHKRRYI